MKAEDEGLLRALRDRLEACELKQGRLRGRLQDAREQIARLKEELEDCLSRTGDCADPGDLQPGVPA